MGRVALFAEHDAGAAANATIGDEFDGAATPVELRDGALLASLPDSGWALWLDGAEGVAIAIGGAAGSCGDAALGVGPGVDATGAGAAVNRLMLALAKPA